MEEPLVSVILPIYNAEKYLSRCYKSLANQSYRNIEVISIIDGSPDNSKNIAIKMSENDSRFVTVVQQNQGSGAARNQGILKSKGEFIVFIDPDDYIQLDMIEYLLALYKLTNAELIVTPLKEEFISNTGDIFKIVNPSNDILAIDDTYVMHKKYIDLFTNDLIGGATGKLYLSRIIRDNNILFPYNKRSQDIVFNIHYFFSAKSLYVDNQSKYVYQIYTDVMIKKIPKDYYMTVIQINQLIMDYYEKEKIIITEKQKIELANHLLGMLAGCVEACISNKFDMEQLLCNKETYCIINESKPRKIYHRILKLALSTRNYRIITSIVHLKYFAKKHMKY